MNKPVQVLGLIVILLVVICGISYIGVDVSPLLSTIISPLLNGLITGFGLGIGFYLSKNYLEK
jgi:hypothetical protein